MPRMHEPDIRSALLPFRWTPRCTCGTYVGPTVTSRDSALELWAAHYATWESLNPITHEIEVSEFILGGCRCGCACGAWDGGKFSNRDSAVLAWRRHSGL